MICREYTEQSRTELTVLHFILLQFLVTLYPRVYIQIVTMLGTPQDNLLNTLTTDELLNIR